jgi:hypothetical protein
MSVISAVAAGTLALGSYGLVNATPAPAQAFLPSCASGSVDGPAPRSAMCFGTMFPQLPAFHYSDQAAADLAAAMENPTPDPPGTDRGTADDSATLPAEYTYLGQFIDHNLDFDETPQPTANVNPSSLTNFESFRFDLNNVFGGGPSVDPQLYAADHTHLLVSGTLGTPQADGFPTVTGTKTGVFDLARVPKTGQAILVEPRDDETQILSQISAALVAFYNDFVNNGLSYTAARQLTVDYYQEIVLTDVLPAFVGQTTINKYLQFSRTGQADVDTPNLPNLNFTPIEFSVGAYRFGHALVRDDYHINDIFPTTTDIDDNVSIFNLNAFQTGDLSGGGPLPGPSGKKTTCTSTSLCDQPNPAGHQIQWKYFVPELDANPNDPGINFARQTQPTISPALFNLPAETIAGCADAASPVCNGTGDLISRDFARGNYDGLASGQAIAKALGCRVIPAASINPTKDAVFNTGTPLIYYVLAEAQQANQVLGCVGQSIVAQTFLQALWDTPNSILHTSFRPDPSLVKLAPESPTFSFGDLLVDTGLAPRSS